MIHMLCAVWLLTLPASPGAVVVAGGGSLSDDILVKSLTLAGGPDAAVVVVPQASALPDTGERSADRWRAVGANHITVLALDDVSAARAVIEQADLIWITGGDQNRLMDALAPSGLDQAIHQRHAAGAVLAGTSAGAAVMARHMFTGNAELEAIVSGSTETRPGLGILPGMLIDQHVHARRRFNRLLSAVLTHGEIGIGVDEGTAVVVRGRELEVLGSSSAVVIDPRAAAIASPTTGTPAGATGLQLHVLTAGMTLKLPADRKAGH